MRLLIAGLPLLLVLASCADLPAACDHGAKNACSSNAVQVRDDQRFMRKLPRQVDSSKVDIPPREASRGSALAAGFPAHRVA